MLFGIVWPALQQRIIAEIERSLAALLALDGGIFVDRLVGKILRPDPPDEKRNGGSGLGLGIEPRCIAGELILVILPGPRPRQMEPKDEIGFARIGSLRFGEILGGGEATGVKLRQATIGVSENVIRLQGDGRTGIGHRACVVGHLAIEDAASHVWRGVIGG
jgi:hypothetical protein